MARMGIMTTTDRTFPSTSPKQGEEVKYEEPSPEPESDLPEPDQDPLNPEEHWQVGRHRMGLA